LDKKKVGAGIGVLVLKNEKVLLGKRHDEAEKASSELHGEGTWTMPGGKLHFQESFEEGAKRELEEETGITDAKVIDGFKEEIEYFYTFEDKRIHKKVVYYLIKSNTKDVKLSYEHDDFEWLTFQEAIERVRFKNLRNVIQKAMKFLENSVD
jgi:8-oxo-dGTP pyrophosphatase MutT (NUDIX family)